ncbi:hypothetical protein L9F63_017294, partial [Diploptera punctata]
HRSIGEPSSPLSAVFTTVFFFADFLETLILKRNCTDAILEKACESSPYLHTVDISSSLLITDKSITALQTLKYLKNLDVFATSITHEGTDILLQLLPSTMNTLGCNSICKLNRFSQLNLFILESSPIIYL